MKKIWLSVLCVSWAVQSEAARVLAVFPFPSISHQVAFQPLIQGILDKGHEVVSITTDPLYPKGQTHANLTEIDLHDLSYRVWRENLIAKPAKSTYVVDVMKLMYELLTIIMDKQFEDERVIDLINDKSKTFDLVLVEACMRPPLIFTHLYKIPAIQVSSLGGMNYNYEPLGLPSHPLLYPSITRQRLHNLTVWEKMAEIYREYQIDRVLTDNLEGENAVIRKHFGNDMPKLEDLYKNVHMLFLNAHPLLEGIRPVSPNVIYMGGIHLKKPKPLPEDLKSYLDSSKNGVIYVSFGTNVDPTKFPPERIKTFVRVFSQFPYDVLWKWNKDELPGRTENIKISKWLPQSDLLRHPKVKLFIMQGGLQSTDEAIAAGVPLIGLPMLTDQWRNAEQYLYHKIGLKLDIEALTDEILMGAINTILKDDSYRQNILKLRALIHDQPQKPLERAVWWVEYVLRHGGAEHLKSPTANMSWWAYLEVELVLTVLSIISAAILLLYYLYRVVTKNVSARIKVKVT